MEMAEVKRLDAEPTSATESASVAPRSRNGSALAMVREKTVAL
jgi:hypothetical protein